ncbi:MAG: tRNA lysidine(34) synthetase TilS [Clostridia bacterium]|nr:tRNA lysidine(34) synthetase TilS [Clostridia bacterium]
MEKEVYDFIKEKKMFKAGDVIGVAVSGGADSMSLLHFLSQNAENFDITVMAITVDHMLRGESSLGDALFVKNWCRENGIVCLKFSVDAGRIAKDKNIGIEEAARQARYGVFDNLLKENKVDKIALAHHMSDQVETILLHLLRGAGLSGASGMEHSRNGLFVRPFLNVSKDEILKYCAVNYVEFVDDESNFDIKYNRNFLRNKIIPKLKKRFEGVEQNIVNFGKSCREDNDFILSQVSHEGILSSENVAKIPLVYFHYQSSVINRIIFNALSRINVFQDIERKHIELIKELSMGENGKKISLPNNIFAQKEYEYMTLFREEKEVIADEYPFVVGKTNFANMYEISIKRTKKFNFSKGTLYMDIAKLPQDAVWRTRKTGDVFTKFGGGTKPLKNYLIDVKIPARLRDTLPVLASKNEIFCVLGNQISEKVKVDDSTKMAYVVSKTELMPQKKLSTFQQFI